MHVVLKKFTGISNRISVTCCTLADRGINVSWPQDVPAEIFLLSLYCCDFLLLSCSTNFNANFTPTPLTLVSWQRLHAPLVTSFPLLPSSADRMHFSLCAVSRSVDLHFSATAACLNEHWLHMWGSVRSSTPTWVQHAHDSCRFCYPIIQTTLRERLKPTWRLIEFKERVPLVFFLQTSAFCKTAQAGVMSSVRVVPVRPNLTTTNFLRLRFPDSCTRRRTETWQLAFPGRFEQG